MHQSSFSWLRQFCYEICFNHFYFLQNFPLFNESNGTRRGNVRLEIEIIMLKLCSESQYLTSGLPLHHRQF